MQFWPDFRESFAWSLRISLSLSRIVYLFLDVCFWPMIYLIIKTFSRKVTLDTENVMSTKLPKKNLLNVQKLLCSKSQNSCGNLLNKNWFFFKVPSWQLKCSFENPAGKSSPGVSKNHTQSRIENVRKLFFLKFFPREGVLDTLTAILTSPLKRNAASPIFVRADSGKSFWENFFKRKPSLLGKDSLDIEKAVWQAWWKKLVEGTESFAQ